MMERIRRLSGFIRRYGKPGSQASEFPSHKQRIICRPSIRQILPNRKPRPEIPVEAVFVDHGPAEAGKHVVDLIAGFRFGEIESKDIV